MGTCTKKYDKADGEWVEKNFERYLRQKKFCGLNKFTYF